MAIDGSNLKNIRKSKGISQEEVADYLEISQTAYSKLENNITKLSAERISVLAHFFNVEEKVFFTSPENIRMGNNTLKFDHVSNLLKSQQAIFDEQKELLQETINILRVQLEQSNNQIKVLLDKME
jgi:transcriptional regulator with XRE-family HTH domain